MGATSDKYFSPEDYAHAAKALDVVCGMVLFEFAREMRSNRDIIIRNFVARSATMAKGIFRLWDMADYQDCWILHRCVIDRLFHLWHLRENNEFETFEAWSFWQQFKALNRVWSDPEFRDNAQGRGFEVTPEQKERARAFETEPPVWSRPKAQDVAKRLDTGFLYINAALRSAARRASEDRPTASAPRTTASVHRTATVSTPHDSVSPSPDGVSPPHGNRQHPARRA